MIMYNHVMNALNRPPEARDAGDIERYSLHRSVKVRHTSSSCESFKVS